MTISWSLDPPKKLQNVVGTGLDIYEQLYGALSQDPATPLSRITVTNAAFSLEPFAGCPARCAYCVVGSSARDIQLDGAVVRMPARPALLFKPVELVDALVTHPAFLPDRSVIGVGNGTTESFLPETERATWEIVDAFRRRGLKNPFWFVTKLGFADGIAERWACRFEMLHDSGIAVVLSVTYSAAPRWMEPHIGDRFRNIARLKRAGIRVSHHLRPILRGVNDSPDAARTAVRASANLADVICIGGLRPDTGLRLVWEQVYKLDPALLPHTNEKDLPEHFEPMLLDIVAAEGLHTPIVTRSTAAITRLLGIDDYALLGYQTPAPALLDIPITDQERIRGKSSIAVTDSIAAIALAIGLNLTFHAVGTRIYASRELLYQERQLLLHAIGHSGFFH